MKRGLTAVIFCLLLIPPLITIGTFNEKIETKTVTSTPLYAVRLEHGLKTLEDDSKTNAYYEKENGITDTSYCLSCYETVCGPTQCPGPTDCMSGCASSCHTECYTDCYTTCQATTCTGPSSASCCRLRC